MKNITVSLDDETYRKARVIAAQNDTSVSALVKRALLDLTEAESEFDRLRSEELRIREQITSFRAADRLTRDEIHSRSA